MTEEVSRNGGKTSAPVSDLDGDDQVLALRESGTSFAAIARKLGMAKAVDAQAAFLRVVRSQPEKERRATVKRESERLDDLEKRTREEHGQDPERAQRRLQAVEKMRRALG